MRNRTALFVSLKLTPTIGGPYGTLRTPFPPAGPALCFTITRMSVSAITRIRVSSARFARACKALHVPEEA